MIEPTAAERIGIIDLGSNTARLIVMRAVPGYAYRLEDEIREVVRLRQGMTAEGLSDEAVSRALFALRLFKRFCDSSNVTEIIATATSAVRDAKNGSQFIEQVQRELNLTLRILEGEREAYYGTLGVLNEISLAQGYVVDIGGGSAQISEVRDFQYKKGQSVPLGALALTERFISTDPISKAEYEAVQHEIDAQLDTISWLPLASGMAKRELVGMGGTIRNLAKIEWARQDYPLNTLHGFQLTYASVCQTIEELVKRPLTQRRRIPGLNSDRADIILPGAMVICAIMRRLQMETLSISHNGLREGLFFERFWQHLAYPVVADVRRFSVLNMARVYDYHKKHAGHVRFLAGRLFNQLAPLHNFGTFEFELLDAAAILHDLGNIIHYYDHHKHSQTLIINSGLPGFSPRETALIGLLSRYHRKGKPRLNEFEAVLDSDDDQRLIKLSAILRMAEFLERGRNGAVDDITAVWDDDTLRLTLIADEYPAVEIWEAEKNATKLLQTAFERQIILESTAAPDNW